MLVCKLCLVMTVARICVIVPNVTSAQKIEYLWSTFIHMTAVVSRWTAQISVWYTYVLWQNCSREYKS